MARPPRTEPLYLLSGVRRGEILRVLPVIRIAAHKGRANRISATALFDDCRVVLVASVDWENTFAILDAKQPLPPTAVEQ